MNLREHRQALGLTQTKAANMIGVTERTWRRWEHGGKMPKAAQELWKLKTARRGKR